MYLRFWRFYCFVGVLLNIGLMLSVGGGIVCFLVGSVLGVGFSVW